MPNIDRCIMLCFEVTFRLNCYTVGVGIYMARSGVNESNVMTNNGYIITSDPYVPSFTCYSGSTKVNVGKLIGLDGRDITHSVGDPFNAVTGGANNPGTLEVHGHGRLTHSDEGVYTCRIPDETGRIVDVNIGIYLDYGHGEYIIEREFGNESHAMYIAGINMRYAVCLNTHSLCNKLKH